MKNNFFAVDGVYYNVHVPSGGIKRSVSILDGANAGRMKSGGMELDTIGTYYNYTVDVIRDNMSLADYDTLHKVLRSPSKRKHNITVPFGQGSVTYEAYIATLEDVLLKTSDGKNDWDALSVTFTATDPNERP